MNNDLIGGKSSFHGSDRSYKQEKEIIFSTKSKEVKGKIWSKYTHGNFEFAYGLQSDMDLKS